MERFQVEGGLPCIHAHLAVRGLVLCTRAPRQCPGGELAPSFLIGGTAAENPKCSRPLRNTVLPDGHIWLKEKKKKKERVIHIHQPTSSKATENIFTSLTAALRTARPVMKRRLVLQWTCWHWPAWIKISCVFLFLILWSKAACSCSSFGSRENGRECKKVLRPDSQAAVRRNVQFLCAEGESCSHWECGVPLRNNHQGLHSDERAPQSLLRQGARYPGCALQPVRTPGETCVVWDMGYSVFTM